MTTAPPNNKNDNDNDVKHKSVIARVFFCSLVCIGLFMLLVNHSVMVSHPHHHDDARVSMQAFTDLHSQLHQAAHMDTKQYLATLQCKDGPSPEIAQEMVYWSDIASDAQYVSPFHTQRGQEEPRFMTFEPDGGGWNNIRMSMETVLAMAHAMGRTLVMPPEQKMYLLGKTQNKQRNSFGFADFFPIQSLADEHVGLEIISMEEFLMGEAMTGKLVHVETGIPTFPPDNRTNWNGLMGKELIRLKEYLRNVTHVAMWRPTTCIAAFPAKAGSPDELQQLQTMKDAIVQNKTFSYVAENHPPNVMGPPQDRMAEILSNRKDLCLYTQEMQQARVVHFMCNHKQRVRLLVHFYCFLFFQDWKQDVWTKRFVRDHVRYVNDLQCAAARVVHAIRQVSKEKGNNNGDFDSFHIRRGDFQFKNTRISAQEIYDNTKAQLQENATIYIATDERNKTFFDPLKQHYHVVFLEDFASELLQGINTNYYGMLDQLVASRGRLFFGCWFSTFTGYITRMRGYHSVKDQLAGYEHGILPNTYYYTLKDRKNAMMTYNYWNTFAREFPTSWRNIDYGIGQMMLDNDHDDTMQDVTATK